MERVGHRCTISGTELSGLIVGFRHYHGDEDKYTVRYLDMSMNPQEREFRASELSFDDGEWDEVTA